MVARKNLRLKVERILVRRLRSEFGNGGRVCVERSGFKDYLNVTVTTKRFAPLDLDERSKVIWKWLLEDLTRKELGKVTGLLPLTPAQERSWFG